MVYGSPENENHNYIPENSQIIVAFNGDKAVKSILTDFLCSQDETLLEKLNTEKGEIKKSTGINFLSDIILFSITDKKEKITGLIFNLTSESDFKTNFAERVIASNKKVGILIFDSNIPEKNLKTIVSNLILKQTNLYQNQLSVLRNYKAHVSIWSKSNATKTNLKYASLIINKNEIKVNGELFIDKIDLIETNKITNNSSSINVSTCLFPKEFGDSILSFIGVSSNQIIGVSANYRSLKIEQENSLEIVPDADFIYQLKNDVSINDVLKKLEAKESISEITATNFVFGGKQFNYKQIDSKTVYIGRTDFNNISYENSGSIIAINGDPSYLTEIEGNSFILRLISIFPAYRAGSNLCNSVKNIDLKFDPTSNHSFKIHGLIEFEKGKYASIELIRNLMELRQ